MNVEKSRLKKVLTKVNAFVTKDNLNATNPPRVLFKAKDGKIQITSCNDTDFGRFTFDTEDKSELGFVTELRYLLRSTTMRGDPVIEFETDTVEFSNGDTHMVFPAQPASSYPLESYELSDDKRIIITTDELKKLIAKVSYCRNEKDSREFATGVHMTFNGKVLMAEGTDGYRAMRNSIELPEDLGFSFNGIINSKAIGMIESLEDGQQVKIGMDDRAVLIDNQEVSVYIVLINTKYPPLDNFIINIPKNATFTLDRDAVIESLALFAPSENKSLVFEGDGDKINIHQDDGVSRINDTIPMEGFTGVPFSFGIDIDMFREIFTNMKEGSTKLNLTFNESQAPIGFSDEERMIGAICPLRKQ